MLSPSSLSVCPPRHGTRRTEERFTFGPRVAEIAVGLELPLMPWQRYVADVALEIDTTTGHLAYRTVVITVPRQSGKTTLILPVMVHRALAFGESQRLIYTAQSLKDARKKWRDDHVDRLERSPFASLFTVRKSMGDEAIVWANGSAHMLAATTKKAAHGETLDFGAIDEAFALPDDRVEAAMRPAMITRPNAQLWIISTQGDDDSHFLNEKVELGRQAVTEDRRTGVAYFEWAAPEGAAMDDPAAWNFHPAVGHTQSAETLMAEAMTMPREEAERAFFNWQKFAGNSEPAIDMTAWAARADEASQVAGKLVLGVAVSPDRKRAALGIAGRRAADDGWHVENIEHREYTHWVADAVAGLVDRQDIAEIVLDARGPAGSMKKELVEAGIDEDLIHSETTTGYTQACGILHDLVVAGADDEGADRVFHRAQPELTAQLDGAEKKTLGDAWLWRRTDEGDITVLESCTLALGRAVGRADESEPKKKAPNLY